MHLRRPGRQRVEQRPARCDNSSTGRPRIASRSDTVGGDTRIRPCSQAAQGGVGAEPFPGVQLADLNRGRLTRRRDGREKRGVEADRPRRAALSECRRMPSRPGGSSARGGAAGRRRRRNRRGVRGGGPARSASAGKEPSGRRARRTPVSSNSSRTAATRWTATASAEPARSASAGRTRPPGKAWKPPMKRRVSARRTTKPSGEPGPRAAGRSRPAGRPVADGFTLPHPWVWRRPACLAGRARRPPAGVPWRTACGCNRRRRGIRRRPCGGCPRWR